MRSDHYPLHKPLFISGREEQRSYRPSHPIITLKSGHVAFSATNSSSAFWMNILRWAEIMETNNCIGKALSCTWDKEDGSDECLQVGDWMMTQMLHCGCLTAGYFGLPVMLPKVLAINNRIRTHAPKLAEVGWNTRWNLVNHSRYPLDRCFFILCRYTPLKPFAQFAAKQLHEPHIKSFTGCVFVARY